IAILIDTNPEWKINTYRQKCFGSYQEIHYRVVKILDYKDRKEELAAINNRFAIVILAQLAVLETKDNFRARLYEKTALTRQLYHKGFKKEDIIQLFNLVDWLITLPKEFMVEYAQSIENFEEEEKMQYVNSFERLGYMRGIEQGRE